VIKRGDLEEQRDQVLRACRRAGSADELLARVDEHLRRAVPYEGSAWFGMDPATLLPTAPARIENVAPGHCETFWQREFLVEDTNLFQSLARDGKPAAALLEATQNRPARSARYREFLKPQGYGDELRAVLRTGSSVWGTLSLFRDQYAPAFTPQEASFVAGVSAALAESLKARLVTEGSPGRGEPNGPGVLMFDRTGRLMSMNADAEGWLDLLPGAIPDAGILPVPVVVLTARAIAVWQGRERGIPSMRLRSRHGRWLVLHASRLAGPATASDGMVMVIEPAKSFEIAPIIVEAYGLTAREQEITLALARGLSTQDVAAELFLSAHTVRDHIKSIFSKLGVSSRGELVATIFADHYGPALHRLDPHVRD
jgi:DNA-binding CsgD family transcriptional regulator